MVLLRDVRAIATHPGPNRLHKTLHEAWDDLRLEQPTASQTRRRHAAHLSSRELAPCGRPPCPLSRGASPASECRSAGSMPRACSQKSGRRSGHVRGWHRNASGRMSRAYGGPARPAEGARSLSTSCEDPGERADHPTPSGRRRRPGGPSDGLPSRIGRLRLHLERRTDQHTDVRPLLATRGQGDRDARGYWLHALRHHYASLLIRHSESVKTVQARLGHASAVETLDTYSHQWPDSDDRTREAIDSALGARADSLRPAKGI